MSKSPNKSIDETLLLRFNGRDADAWGEVYELYYADLIYFTRLLYRNTNVEEKDVIHDVFTKIWESEKIKFKGITNIKSYLYVAIKNNFADWVAHNKCVDRFKQVVKSKPENYVSEMLETETLSIMTKAANFLPEETAKVFQLMLEGWDVKEIAVKLGKSQTTVYIQKQNAMEILKKKLCHEDLFLLFHFFNL